LTGAAYGFIAEKYPRIAAASGMPFGAGVWLFAEELGLPITGLSNAPDKYPLRDHFNAIVAHLVFGSTTEITRSCTRELLGTMMARRETEHRNSPGAHIEQIALKLGGRA
jgi:putative membrane protein